jgi:hypothetical protein
MSWQRDDSNPILFTTFKLKNLDFPWFDFRNFCKNSRQMSKLKICWRDPRAVFEIFGIEVSILISTFAKMASNIWGRYCATKAWFSQ